MKHLVVIAEKEELKLVERLEFKQTPILITGVGGMNVINALKDIDRDTEIYNIGYAGSKDLEPGKIYAAESVTLYHPNVEYKEPIYDLGVKSYPYVKDSENEEFIRPKKCYTSSDFVLSSDKTDCLFDMELAYIAALGFKNVYSYKCVSDNLDLQEHRDNKKKDV